MSPTRKKIESLEGIRLTGSCCLICGWNKKDDEGNLLLDGSHVRAFDNQSEYDNKNNIIGLCPNHHREFDSGNIGIDYKNGICIHLNEKDEFHMKKLIGHLKHIQVGFLDYHNKRKFKGRIE